MRRPLLALVVVAGTLLTGCGGGSDRPQSGSPSGSPTASASASSTSTPSPGAAAPRRTLPDGSRTLLPGHTVVAYYGAAGAPQLGVLGTGGPDQVWPRLARQARAYDKAGHRVLPAYELIAFVATSGGGTAAQRVPDATIRRYAASVRRHHGLLILDIQPGRGQFLRDAKSLRRWLVRPDVALALDPEWKLHAGQQPLGQIGHTDAAAVNQVSGWLDRLTARRGLPQKMLLVHQFTPDMVRHKPQVARRAHLAMVFNMDGFGSRAAKLSKYRMLARDKRFPIGLKLFYRHDQNLFTPHDVMRLHPAPAVVDYE